MSGIVSRLRDVVVPFSSILEIESSSVNKSLVLLNRVFPEAVSVPPEK